MIGENRQLVPDEPVEFEEKLVEVQDCRKITDHFRGIHRVYPNLVYENRRMSKYNRLDLQTLGSQRVMPTKIPDHWCTLNPMMDVSQLVSLPCPFDAPWSAHPP